MRAIRSKDTGPEMTIRRLVHRLGYRFRLHAKKLPGAPDIVLPSRRKIIFVHGCFWHMHESCRDGRIPQSREEYWRPKLYRTRERDQTNVDALSSLGWESLIIWECELRDMEVVRNKVVHFLERENPNAAKQQTKRNSKGALEARTGIEPV
jgi:DNA mismatch endonuclease (patch repair protein)